MEVNDLELLDWAVVAMELLAGRCGAPQTTAPTLILLGEFPESVLEGTSGVHLIYLIRDSDRFQLAGQLAHEAFHRWCTPPEGGGWIHEMLAEVFRMDLLIAAGLTDYADKYLREAAIEAELFPTANLAKVERFSYPAGFYARVLVDGLEAREKLGTAAFWNLRGATV